MPSRDHLIERTDHAAQGSAVAHPSHATVPLSGGPDRRTFLKLLGLSISAAALGGCRPPREKIVPYLHGQPELTPGIASWYASTCHGCPAACGMLVKVLDGRPIKLEGNPDHVLSRGGLCAVGQGSIVGLYDPYRQRVPTRKGAAVTIAEADAEITRHLQAAKTRGGKVVIVTGPTIGPSTRSLIGEFLGQFPNGAHIVYEPLPYSPIAEGFKQACGMETAPAIRMDRARTVVSFGADFLGTWLSPVEFAKQYASRRAGGADAFRHVQVEARLSLTGSNADWRYPLSPSGQAVCVAALFAEVAGRLRGIAWSAASLPPTDVVDTRVQQIVNDLVPLLLEDRGKCLVIGDSADPAVQILLAALNYVLGNIGETLDPQRPISLGSEDQRLFQLVSDMEAGNVEVLIVHGCNPALSWPQREPFARALAKVACSVSTSVTPDETTALVDWHVPAHHPMEAWGDAEPQAGVYSLHQPTIRPLYRTRAFEDSLLRWMNRPEGFHAYLQAHWRKHIYPRAGGSGSFEDFWNRALQSGCVVTPPQSPTHYQLRQSVVADALRQVIQQPRSSDSYEIELYETVALRDGTWANNPWLQELPDPVTKITWGAGAAMAEATAKSLGLREGDWISIEGAPGVRIELPVQIQPGQEDRTISVPVGYGRKLGGPIASGHGVDAYPLVRLEAGRRHRSGRIVSLAPQRSRAPIRFARTQPHDSMEGRDVVREDYRTHPREVTTGPGQRKLGGHAADHAEANLWGKPLPSERQWGMVIDLTRCIGCSACVTACDIENNVPAVGPAEVARSREMHWMRLDRYYVGEARNPRVLFQPMLCQQCANASCESVCPALATVHDDQGLNVQVYNRCVGTRYCANNCPYKVRRFNWFDNQAKLAMRRLGLNPSVTVRSRGVMEKCSFCIQRIQEARIRSRNEGRDLSDGEVQTACQQSCPADAIVFGDLQDPNSRVARYRAHPDAYRVLEELNRQPAISYLPRRREPLPTASSESSQQESDA